MPLRLPFSSSLFDYQPNQRDLRTRRPPHSAPEPIYRFGNNLCVTQFIGLKVCGSMLITTAQ